MIKLEIRNFCICFSKQISKDKKGKEIDLLCKLKQLNVLLDQNPQDTKLAKEAGYVKNRFIGENMRLISDVMEFYEKKNLPGMLLFIDFEKAFDSLEWNYLFKVLEVMNFGPMFQKWIHTFYTNITSFVMNNGYVSHFFQFYRGVRQGCPLSGPLFVLAIEVLAQAISQNENIHGLRMNKTELKLSMYVDDLTAFVKDECSANHLFKLLDDFGACSGLKISI